jgi:hypothetical protein
MTILRMFRTLDDPGSWIPPAFAIGLILIGIVVLFFSCWVFVGATKSVARLESAGPFTDPARPIDPPDCHGWAMRRIRRGDRLYSIGMCSCNGVFPYRDDDFVDNHFIGFANRDFSRVEKVLRSDVVGSAGDLAGPGERMPIEMTFSYLANPSVDPGGPESGNPPA